MSSDPLIVLVRPWRDARGGAGGCCAAPVPRFRLCDDEPLPRAEDDVSLLLGRTYELLRDSLPTADVQIVDASNSVYLVPTTFSRVRRRSGTRPALAAALRATTPGAVLVDGECVGDLEELGPEGVLEAVRDVVAAGRDPETRAGPVTGAAGSRAGV
ncbi:hypothetical protein KZX45_03420 [Georgenia sp. EYE_87]|uniref:hypothetical protein n=1 Tax=Georgenia sp. EYE_87 TaxID=2853448 RepID=UPI002002C55C|nr:hypothetical protein [Georgenia sp. EYE_87]MCK6209592.1 hypothetical protein [Georgenia sp. EYE_87]